jgi:hypothetical protein
VDASLHRVLFVPGESGFVAFEWLPTRDLLNESARRTRGANVTSLDALMLGQRTNGQIVILAIEWKFLETYGQQAVPRVSRAGTDRLARYQALLDDSNCPLKPRDPATFFYEPYYQLMHQTLLVWQMTREPPDGWPKIHDWLHIQIIPAGNVTLLGHVPRAVSDFAQHETMESAWRSVLKRPKRYRVMTPAQLIPSTVPREWHDWRKWLKGRYARSTIRSRSSSRFASFLLRIGTRATASKMRSRDANTSAGARSDCRP